MLGAPANHHLNFPISLSIPGHLMQMKHGCVRCESCWLSTIHCDCQLLTSAFLRSLYRDHDMLCMHGTHKIAVCAKAVRCKRQDLSDIWLWILSKVYCGKIPVQYGVQLGISCMHHLARKWQRKVKIWTRRIRTETFTTFSFLLLDKISAL